MNFIRQIVFTFVALLCAILLTIGWSWKWFLAYFRLSKKAVCEMSEGLGLVDYHDYHDTVEGEPWHFVTLKCQRCGKEFTI